MEFQLDNFDDEVSNAEESINIGEKATSQADGNEGGSGSPLCGESEDGEARKAVDPNAQALGLFSDISNDDYHSGPGISSTQLKHELKCSKLYRAYDTGELKFKQTKQMRLGSAVHVLSLEPFDFYNQVAVLPNNAVGTSARAKEFRTEFESHNRGKIFIKAEELEVVKYMRDALAEHPEAGELLFDPDGQPEMSGYYRDINEDGSGTRMLLKYRPDIRYDWCIGDIKSTVDASEEAFSRTIGNFGYDISCAHYLEGDKHTSGTDHDKFFFICVESAKPWLVAVYWLDERGLKTGRWRRRKTLHSISQCRKKQHWPGLNEDKVKSISVPNNLAYSMEQEQ